MHIVYCLFFIPVAFDEVKSFSDFTTTETEDEGFMAGPYKSTTNIGWLVGSSNQVKSPHIDIYEAGQVKPPPYLNVKEHPMSPDVQPTQFGYNLSRSKSVCDLSVQQNSQMLNNSEKSFTIDRKRVKHHAQGEEPTPHRSRVVRNRTILGSFPLFYKLSQSLSSLNTKSDHHHHHQIGSDCGAFYGEDDNYSDR